MSVPDDQAGGMIQCPKCSRLLDVPTHTELRNIDAEGNFRIGALELPADPRRLREVTRAFTRERFDEHGNEIDLRPSLDDVDRAGVEEIPFHNGDIGDTPKYDPITGELVQPLDVKPNADLREAGHIPMATPVLGYAGRREAAGPSVWTLGLQMFMPQNVFVVFIIVLMHVMLQMAIMPIAAGLFFFAFVPIGIVMLLAGHYGRVVQETGPGDQDDLPRPFGNLSWRDDIWDPFVQTMAAWMIAYGPSWIVFLAMGRKVETLVAMAPAVLWGAIAFPAAFLAATSSGTLLNLRPDRLLGTIRQCGAGYVVPMCLLFVGPIVYFFGVFGFGASVFALFVRNMLSQPGLVASAGFLALVMGIFITHWGCWALGVLYRGNHEAFPWILQRHVYKNRTTLPPRRRKRVVPKRP